MKGLYGEHKYADAIPLHSPPEVERKRLEIDSIYCGLVEHNEHRVADMLMGLGRWRAVATLHYDELTADEMASAILSMQCPEEVKS